MHRLARFSGPVEFRTDFRPRPGITDVLFDFDGTLSLLRQGWPDVMVPMFIEFLPAGPDESPDDLRRLAFEDIMRLNGKQTIYQMIQLAARIRERGGQPREPLWYKHEYLRRLEERIQDRKQAVRLGQAPASEFLVHDARRALDLLAGLNLKLHLASGTDEQFVQEEAELLGIADCFQGRIYGARDDYQSFSKQLVIERILQDLSCGGEQLLAFGDGYVEIENTKQAGGLAVAVASDEAHNGSGRFDPWKYERLLGVGADVVIPDFRDIEPLVAAVLGRSIA
jgi:phosphoglycolate phosphatase-like HAD superfamily hydrolase